MTHSNGHSKGRKLLTWLRWQLAKRDPRSNISHPAWIGPRVAFDFTSDGFFYGGAIKIGAGATICTGALISPYGGCIEIGAGVFIGPYCVLYGHGGLSIGARTMIASHCVIVPSMHIFDTRKASIADQGSRTRGIIIEEDVWLGAGCKVLDGVRIRKGAVVGAGAVVTRDVGEFSIVAGVPARLMRLRN